MQLQHLKGLSLIEILVALFVASILFTVAARAISSGGKGLATIISHSELLEDTRYAGEMIHSSLQNSVYVYPPQTELILNESTEYHTKNPRTSDNEWVIGQDQIIAMIVAPKIGTTTCSTDPNACLSFVAYYTIKRSDVTSTNGLTYTGGTLPIDANNPDALMIFEYRKVLNVSSLDVGILPPVSYENDSLAGSLKDVTARLVADYINPNNGFVITPTYCISNRTLCPAAGETPIALNHENSILSGNITVSALYNKGRQSYTTPELEFSFSPRNLY